MNPGSTTGFMIVRNVLSQGYPFAEAVASGLGICDEFLISDGYSTDGTYEILLEIARANRKVKIYRDLWPETHSFSRVLREATNILRRRALGRYLLNLQANEVVHENSLEFLGILPEIMPKYLTFGLPFTQLLNNHIYREEFRIRFVKNVDYVEAVDDAWTLGIRRSRILRHMILNPHKIPRYLARGVYVDYANTASREYSKIIYPPQPVFRYYSLFPSDFLEKMRNHMKSFREYEWKCIERFVSRHSTTDLAKVDTDVFWSQALEALREFTSQFEELPKRTRPDPVIHKDQHPRIIRDFIENPSVHRYYVRPEVLDTIKDL
jgi:glycosyltransferase involved in cell wall biosynthesis